MRIEDLELTERGSRVRVTATVKWEDCERPVQQIYFETEDAFKENMTFCNPHAFLVGCILPAMRYGEKRIAIDGEICPRLLSGLKVAMGFIRKWSNGEREVLEIEAKPFSNLRETNKNATAGLFLSGGIDSVATLYLNKQNYPEQHPLSVKKCLLVHGFDIGGDTKKGPQHDFFDLAMTALSKIAKEAHVPLIPVYSNIKSLCNEGGFWIHEFHGIALAAVAHAMASGFNIVYVASTYDIPNLAPWGSHPLLDPQYSSYDLRIEHEGIAFSRLAKARLIGDWDVALQNIRVCTKSEEGTSSLNCGKCEKCIRTMTALLSIGALDRSNAFPADDVSVKLLSSVAIKSGYQASCYRELIEPLRQCGRRDLAMTIKYLLAKHPVYRLGESLKKRIKRFDRRYLNNNIVRLKRRILHQEI